MKDEKQENSGSLGLEPTLLTSTATMDPICHELIAAHVFVLITSWQNINNRVVNHYKEYFL